MHDIIYSYARDKKTQLCRLLLSSMPDLDLGHTSLIFYFSDERKLEKDLGD